MGTTDWHWFQPGDIVCYSEGHHEWMVKAARWPTKFVPRTALRGTVTDTTSKTVTVCWNHGSDPTVHFPDNLEILVSHSYEEQT